MALATQTRPPATPTLNEVFEVAGHLTEESLPGATGDAYRQVHIEAASETGLDDGAFPADRPYGFEGIMSRPVHWPPEDQAF